MLPIRAAAQHLFIHRFNYTEVTRCNDGFPGILENNDNTHSWSEDEIESTFRSWNKSLIKVFALSQFTHNNSFECNVWLVCNFVFIKYFFLFQNKTLKTIKTLNKQDIFRLISRQFHKSIWIVGPICKCSERQIDKVITWSHDHFYVFAWMDRASIFRESNKSGRSFRRLDPVKPESVPLRFLSILAELQWPEKHQYAEEH